MDWSNESYVRLYVRDTVTWRLLGWDGQNALTQLLRKVDRAGTMDLGGVEPWEALVLTCGAPEDQAQRGCGKLLEKGVIRVVNGMLVFPNYIQAQTANKSDKLRQKESRDRKASGEHLASSQIGTAPSRGVTNESRGSGPRHDSSQPVTSGHSVLCSAGAVLCDAKQIPPTPQGDGVEGLRSEPANTQTSAPSEPPIGENPAQLEIEPGEPHQRERAPRQLEGHRFEVSEALRGAYGSGFPRIASTQLDVIVAHCLTLQRDYRVAKLTDVAAELCKAARPGTRGWIHDVQRVDPYRAPEPRPGQQSARSGRAPPAPATTGKDFEHDYDFDKSMRILRGEAQ